MLSRVLKDRLASRLMFLMTLSSSLLLLVMVLALYCQARPILATRSLGQLLFSSSWHPQKGEFGLYPFILGTLWVTVLAMIISIPLSLLAAIYLAEYAPGRMRAAIKPLIDLLAGIPSVVYGLWGVLAVVPLIRGYIAPFLGRYLGSIPLFSAENTTGYSVLAGSIVLSIMVFPVIISIADEVLEAVPDGLREASLSLGATKWQVVKHVISREVFPGIIAGIVLGFSRAFGETMAVLMVVGNVPAAPSSIFDPAYPLTALIANNYGEMMSIPLYDSALLGAALVLMLVVLFFNISSRFFLNRALRARR